VASSPYSAPYSAAAEGSAAANPYLDGNFAPVTTELTIEEPLPMDGAIPDGLEGLLLRNGPNPAMVPDPSRYHWFAGDGMVHAVELRDGAAVSYRNRWVRTRKLSREVGTPSPPGPAEPLDGPANTHVVYHGGRVLALVETGFPHRMTTDLRTVRVEDFGGMLTSPMTAHPHRDPDTGGLAFFGYDVFGPPFLRYHELDASGDLVHSTDVEVPRATMQHDFGVTASRVAFLDLPVVFDMNMAVEGNQLPFRWEPEAGARVGVLTRGGAGEDTTWIDIDPCYVFHVMNAFDDGAAMVLDVCRYERTFDTGPGELIGSTLPHLQRWRVDPAARRVDITDVDDRNVDFPRVDDVLVGRPYRYGYCVRATQDTTTDFVGLVRYDLERDVAIEHEFDAGQSPGEPIFVRAHDGHADDEGWVITVVYDAARDASDVVILDATSFAGKPEAVIHLPARIPFGFHGSWVPAADYR
jgi:carotenoid cleavage dioxygenase